MSDGQEIIERVAYAICLNITGMPITEQEWKWGAAENPEEAEGFRKAARAAIEAMREPSQAALDAWADLRFPSTEGDWDEALDNHTAASVWDAGIDAALPG